MPNLFEPLKVNSMTLPNRIVRSATMDNLGHDGMVTDAEVELYRALGEGEIGLIISHGLFPVAEGCASAGQLGVHKDDTIPSLQKLVKAVHQGGGMIAAQILHGGWQCRPEISGLVPVGPSALVNPWTGLECRALSGEEISGLVEQYVAAARRIIEAGFDAVQLHGAHSWLLSAFLSPVANRREDEWGGSVENRARFVRLIIEGIRRMAGPDYPILIKIGVMDCHRGGRTLEEGIETLRILEAAGLDAFEISEGLEEERGHHIRQDALRPYYKPESALARQALGVPVIIVGGLRAKEDMQAVLDEGVADAVSMCRPFVHDTAIVRKLREGQAAVSGCNSCNKCIGRMHGGKIHCALTGDQGE